ncbi:MAG: CHASE3 domain-containing protein, partial [Candidatus Dormiibacterota bacterium]
MQARTRVAPNRSLTERLARAFAAVSVLIVATLAVTGGCFAVVLQHFEPSVNALIAGRGAIDEVQNGMLDEESGLRGYLDSGDQVFLASYYGGRQEILSGDS